MVTIIGENYNYEDGVGIVNCARGGVIDEVALVKALTAEKYVCWIGCFENEPTPEMTILMNSKNLINPHIGCNWEKLKIELVLN
jgi:D-3-phosphoglycerate dehydrogenase